MKLKNHSYFLACILLLIAHSFKAESQNFSKKNGISFDFNTRYQTIEGFGSCIVNYRDFPPEYSDPKFFDRVVNDLGLTIVRVPLMEHTEWENDNNDPDSFNWNGFWLADNIDRKGIETSMNLMQKFKEHGVVRFMATPWSPPEFVKTNRSPIQGGYLRADMFDEYAEYMAAQIILSKKNYGIDLNWVTVQNELLFSQFYRSCVYQPWVLKEAVRALMHKFKKEGINTKILMPEDMMFVDRMLFYIEPTMNDPETKNYNGHFTTHRRGGKDELLEWVAETNQYKRQNWMTETSGHDPTWEGALKMANDIQEYLVYGNFSAWVYWQLSGGGNGRYSIMVNGQPGIKYYASKHFYRFIRPNSVRISANSQNENLFVSAFHNPYDGTLTSVIINNDESPIKVPINSKFEFDVYVSTKDVQFKDGGKVASGGTLEVPAKSITTLYAENTELITGEEEPKLPESWRIPKNSGNEKWGNSNTFPRRTSFQVKPDGGNISIYPDLKEADTKTIINKELHNGWNLLHLTIMNGDGDAVKYLIDQGIDINKKANDGLTPLHMAASTFAGNKNKDNRTADYNKYDIFKLVLNANADIHAKTDDGWTALHAATANAYTGWRGNPDFSLQRINDLIAAGVDIESKDKFGRTPLHWAAMQGYLLYTGVPSVKPDVVELFIESGANIEAIDKDGNTPLHLAVKMGYPEIVLALIKSGAKTNTKNQEKRTPVDIASESDQDILLYIFENKTMPVGSAIKSQEQQNSNEYKFGPELLKAAWKGNKNKVIELLDKGADIKYRDSDGFNALERARDNGHEEIVKLIMKAMNE